MAERILGNELFCLAARPKALSPLLFSRYDTGMQYGSHVDDALMGGMRTDISFTLFLSDATSYDGGELIIDSASGEETFKLEAGALVAYPATSLHRVGAVTRGARLAAVGWARSFVRDPAQRELLFDLDTARRQLFAREGKSAEFDLISKVVRQSAAHVGRGLNTFSPTLRRPATPRSRSSARRDRQRRRP